MCRAPPSHSRDRAPRCLDQPLELAQLHQCSRTDKAWQALDVIQRLRFYTSALLDGPLNPDQVVEDWPDWFRLAPAFVAAYGTEEFKQAEDTAVLLRGVEEHDDVSLSGAERVFRRPEMVDHGRVAELTHPGGWPLPVPSIPPLPGTSWQFLTLLACLLVSYARDPWLFGTRI